MSIRIVQNGTDARRERAFELREAGATHKEIALEVGVHVGTVSRWFAGKSQADADRQTPSTAEQVRAEVERQLAYDEARPSPQGVLLARVDALRATQRAFLHGELGADAALRQGFIDVAAAAELCAIELDRGADAFAEATTPEPARVRV